VLSRSDPSHWLANSSRIVPHCPSVALNAQLGFSSFDDVSDCDFDGGQISPPPHVLSSACFGTDVDIVLQRGTRDTPNSMGAERQKGEAKHKQTQAVCMHSCPVDARAVLRTDWVLRHELCHALACLAHSRWSTLALLAYFVSLLLSWR
jgi:hypothetical protein